MGGPEAAIQRPPETMTRRTRRSEVLAFAILAIVVWPVLTVGIVGAYGFTVWMYQQLVGPPRPHSR
jgi:nitrate reductase NapE